MKAEALLTYDVAKQAGCQYQFGFSIKDHK